MSQERPLSRHLTREVGLRDERLQEAAAKAILEYGNLIEDGRDLPDEFCEVMEALDEAMTDQPVSGSDPEKASVDPVKVLGNALAVHQHVKGAVGYCYRGHGEDAGNEAAAILRELPEYTIIRRSELAALRELLDPVLAFSRSFAGWSQVAYVRDQLARLSLVSETTAVDGEKP